MDSNSDDETFSHHKRIGRRLQRICDSESESDSNNNSNESPLNSSTESKDSANRSKLKVTKTTKKSNRKFVIDSDSDSNDNDASKNDETSDKSTNNEDDNSNMTADNTQSEDDAGSSRSHEISSVNKSVDYDDTIGNSNKSLNISTPIPNAVVNVSDLSVNLGLEQSGADIEIPASDDDEAESRCFSPRTRLSITGRRPKDLEISDDDDIFQSDPEEIPPSDDEEEKAEEDKENSPEVSNKRGRHHIIHNISLNDSVAKTPQSKRQSLVANLTVKTPKAQSLLSTNTTADVLDHKSIIVSSSEDELKSVAIEDSDESSQLLKTIASTDKDVPVLIIDSSDDENTNDLTRDFTSIGIASTPEIRKPLVQPKLVFPDVKKLLMNKATSSAKKTYVSQEFYNNNIEKLEKLKAELELNKDLYSRMKQALPDNGNNLMRRIQALQSEINRLQAAVDSYVIEEDGIMNPELKASTEAAAVLPSWNDIESGINTIRPVHTGQQGLHTFNEQKAMTMECLKTMHNAMETCPAPDMLAPTPNGLKIELMPHQRHALVWMRWRERQRPRGGVLADDMGLGKTLTVIALVLACEEENAEQQESSDDDDDDDGEAGVNNNNVGWMSKKNKRKDFYYGGTLIICPASLINQWENEVLNRVKRKYLTVGMHHGNSRETSARKLSKNNILITTYGIVASEAKNSGPLFQVKWERIVLDEAHVIRNHNTNMSQSCCNLKGTKRWGLTGTPIQNKELDLYSVLKFLKCRPFDELPVFKKWISTNSQGGRDRLHNLLRPMLLRRTKLELQDQGQLQSLPSKTINIVKLTLTKDEMNVYSKILTLSQTLFAQFLHQRAEREHVQNMGNFMARGKPNEAFDRLHQKFSQMHGAKDEVKASAILVLLTRLRQICDHPGLIDQMLEDDNNSSGSDDDEDAPNIDLLEQLNKLNLNDHSNSELNTDQYQKSSQILKRSNPVFDFGNMSSKFRKALEVVKEILADGDDKIVIISQWTSVLNIFARYLQRERIYFVELNGKTPIKDRNDIVVNFNKPSSRERIMLLSLVAGGVGLNLVGANQLLLLDPHWNPQLESQAADRVYRVGQNKPVQIYKLLCDNTIEERIKALQDSKLSLSEHVLTGSSNSTGGSKLSLQDLRQLFDM